MDEPSEPSELHKFRQSCRPELQEVTWGAVRFVCSLTAELLDLFTYLTSPIDGDAEDEDVFMGLIKMLYWETSLTEDGSSLWDCQ